MGDKPLLVFFKMFNCGHCTQFAEQPSVEASPWAEMLRDPEMQNMVEFVRYDFGIEAKNGQTVRHKLPEQYSFVNYGPYFYLHNPNSVADGLEFTPSDSQKYTRSAKGLKNWIKDSLQKEPKLRSSVVKQAPPPAKTPVPSPVQRPALPNSSGFLNQKPSLKTPPAPTPAAVPAPNPAARVRSSRSAIKVPTEVPTAPMAIRARNRRRK